MKKLSLVLVLVLVLDFCHAMPPFVITNIVPATIDTNYTLLAAKLNFNYGSLIGWLNSNDVLVASLQTQAAALTNPPPTYFTNLVSGQSYSNLSPFSATWRVPVQVSSPALTLGNAEVDAQVRFPGGTFVTVDGLSLGDGATSIIATNGRSLNFEVPSGWVFCITNNLIGIGYAAQLDPAKTNQVTFHR